jgi:hypothetical protein
VPFADILAGERSRFPLLADVTHLGGQHERSVDRKSLHTNATISARDSVKLDQSCTYCATSHALVEAVCVWTKSPNHHRGQT